MKKKIKKGYGNAALILGIIGLLSLFMPYIGIVLSILALIFANKQTPVTGNASAGKVMGIIGICTNGIMLLLVLFVFAVMPGLFAL